MSADQQSNFDSRRPPCEKLTDLIIHREALGANDSVESVSEFLRHSPAEFIGILDNREVLKGIISRSTIIETLSGRFGFSLHRDLPISDFLVKDPLIIIGNTSLDQVVEDVFEGQECPNLRSDAAMVDEDGKFLGIISSSALIEYQWWLSQNKTREIARQKEQLQTQNRELFEKISALRDRDGQFNILFENDVLGVALLAESGLVSNSNARFQEITGFDSDSITKFCFTDLIASSQRESLIDSLKSLQENRGGPQSLRIGSILENPKTGDREVSGYATFIQKPARLLFNWTM